MESPNFREILKNSCVEVHGVPENATSGNLLKLFEVAGVSVSYLQCKQTWLILLQDSKAKVIFGRAKRRKRRNKTRKMYRKEPKAAANVLKGAESSPLFYEDTRLYVGPCNDSSDIPKEWDKYSKATRSESEENYRRDMDNVKQSDSEPFIPGPTNIPPGQGSNQKNSFYAQDMMHPHGHDQQFIQEEKPRSGICFENRNFQHWSGLSYPPMHPGNTNSLRQYQPFSAPFMQMPQLGYPYPPWGGYQPLQRGPNGEIIFPNNNMPALYESIGQKDFNKIQKVEESDSESDPETTNRIKVKNISPNVTRSKLESFFKSRKTGGAINSVDYRKDKKEAVIAFKNPTVVQKVLQKRPLLLDNNQIEVEKYFSDTDEETDNSEGSDTEQCSCIIEVRGMKDSTSFDTLKYYFESKRAAGVPVEIDEFDFERDKKIARVKYASEEGMKKVLARQHTVDGAKLNVKEYFHPKPLPMYDNKILLRNVQPITTKDGISNFLEAKIDVETTEILYGEEEGVVVVSFAEPPEAVGYEETGRKKIDPNNTTDGHCRGSFKCTEDGNPGTLDLDITSHPKDVLIFLSLIVFLPGLGDLTRIIELPPVQLFESLGHSIPLPPKGASKDFQKLVDVCQKKAVDGNYLQVSRVTISNCIKIKGISSRTGQDTLELYFENKRRSGGSEVERINYNPEEGTCIVYFKDYKVVDSVCAKKHIIDGQKLEVKMFHPMLGDVSDEDGAKLKLPEPIIIRTIEERKIQFLLSSKTFKESLQTSLSGVYSTIIWPSDYKGCVKIECTLTNKVKGCRKLVNLWKKETLSKLNEFLDTLSVEKIGVLQDVWKDFIEVLQNKSIPNPDSVAVAVENMTREIFIMGKSLLVSQMTDELKQDLKVIENELEREKKQVIEHITLKSYQLLLLSQEHFIETTQRKYKRMKITCHMKSDQITFEGLASEVMEAKVAMYQTISNIASSDAGIFSEGKLKLLHEPEVHNYILNIFKNQNISAVWNVEQGNPRTFAKTEKDAVKAAHILKKSVVESHIPLPKESQYIIHQEVWENKVADIKRTNVKYTVNIDWVSNAGVVTVCSTDVDAGEVLEIIQNFLTDNTILESKLELKSGMMRFLQQNNRPRKIEGIANSLKSDQVEIDISNHGIEIKGTVTGISKTKSKLIAFIQMVKKKKHVLNEPGITKLMLSDDGEDQIKRIEGRNDVIIMPDDGDAEEEIPRQQSGQVVQELARTEKEYFAVMALLGDITELQTDVLVNAANGTLKHGGGLAKAIVVKGGMEIQRECDTHIKRQGKLDEGEVFCGKPGKLKCKMIVHAVSPAWQTGSNGEESTLSELVYTCLERTNENGFSSIAIPALGAGTFGVPVAVAARSIVSAVDEYFDENKNSTIKHIFLCDVNRNHVESFIKAMKRQFGSRMVIDTSNSADIQQLSSSHTVRESSDERKRNSRFSGDSCDPDSNAGITLDGNIQVSLVKGEIAKQKVDVIVNTTGRDLLLHNGAVSHSILQAAGKGLQDECSQLYPQGIKYGEIAVTAGHKLRCRNVFHGSLPQWDYGKTAQKILQKFMTECLEEASSQHLHSLAFPAMGTGNLGYPRDVVAKMMYGIVSQFALDNPRSTLKKIDFVVYHKDLITIKAFEDVNEFTTKNAAGSVRKAPVIASPKSERKSRQFGTGGQKNVSSTEKYVQDIGKLKLKIYQGDITKASVDAIVNNTDAEFDLSRGEVAKVIKEKGGKELERQISLKMPEMDIGFQILHSTQNFDIRDIMKGAACGTGNYNPFGAPDFTSFFHGEREMKKNGVAVTTSGSGLTCRFVIHLNTATPDLAWKSKIQKALQEADNSSGTIKSIAFPALGTSFKGGPKPEDMARYFFEALMEFQASAQSFALKEVHIIVFQEEMVLKFIDTARTCFEVFNSVKPKNVLKQFSERSSADPKDESYIKTNVRKIAMDPSSYPLIIYGDSTQVIIDAITQLETSLQNFYTTKEFKDKLIKNFNKAQELTVKRLESRFNVAINFKKTKGKLEIYGLRDNITEAVDVIYKELRESEREKQLEQEANLIADMVMWCFIEVTSTKTELEPYPPNINGILEKAFKRQEKKVSFQDNKGITYWVDLDNFEEYLESNPSDKVQVIRKNKLADSKFDMPSHWEDMKDQEHLLVVPLQATDKEYQDVVTEFQRTVGNPRNVLSVERIQNCTLYQQYIAKKQLMDKQNQSTTQNERLLWHGTAPEAVDSINTYGFNRSYCGKNATYYGLGVYFAVESNYSARDTYSRADQQGKKRVYYCRVLTGDYTQGIPDQRVPPQKPNSPAHILYDSVVNDVNNPVMYIIFNDTQAYPDYILTFQ